MAWCETVELGIGPCEGCSKNSASLENSGLSAIVIEIEQSAYDTKEENNKSLDDVNDC